MAVTTEGPSATGTPNPAAPTAGQGAEGATSAELQNVDDVLMAELGLTPEQESGDEPTGEAETDTAGKEESPVDAGEDEEPAGDEDDEPDEEEEPETPPAEEEDDPETGEATGTPKAIRARLEKAGLSRGELKRVDKAFAKNAEYRARIAELEQAQGQQGEPVVLAPTSVHPLSDVRTPQQLDERTKQAEQWLEWCEANPDGGEVSGKELTADDVKNQRRWANTVLRKAPERAQYLATNQAAKAAAQQMMPEMFRKGTPEFNAAKALITGVPEWLNQPDYHVSLSHMVRGLRQWVRESQGYTYVEVPPSKTGKKAADAGAAAPVKPAAAAAKASKPPLNHAPSKPAGRSSTSKPDVDAIAKSGDAMAMLEAELA